jgi:hypothetical protein
MKTAALCSTSVEQPPSPRDQPTFLAFTPRSGGEREQLWNWWRGASRDVNRTMKERLGLIQDPVVRERIRHHFTERSKHLDRLAAMDQHHGHGPEFNPFQEKLAWPEPVGV